MMMIREKPRATQRLWAYALMLIVLFTLTHLLGFQEHVSILAGVHSGNTLEQGAGMLYLMLSFSAVCIAPIFLIGGLLRWLLSMLEGASEE